MSAEPRQNHYPGVHPVVADLMHLSGGTADLEAKKSINGDDVFVTMNLSGDLKTQPHKVAIIVHVKIYVNGGPVVFYTAAEVKPLRDGRLRMTDTQLTQNRVVYVNDPGHVMKTSMISMGLFSSAPKFTCVKFDSTLRATTVKQMLSDVIPKMLVRIKSVQRDGEVA